MAVRCACTLRGRSVRRLRRCSAHWCSECHVHTAELDLTGNKEPPPCDQELQTAGGGDSAAQKHQRRNPASSQGHDPRWEQAWHVGGAEPRGQEGEAMWPQLTQALQARVMEARRVGDWGCPAVTVKSLLCG